MNNTLAPYLLHYPQGWVFLSRAWENTSSETEIGFKAQALNTCKKAVIIAAGAIYTIVTPIFVVIDLIYTYATRDRKLDGNCYLFFKTDLFDHCRNQIKNIVNTHLANKNSDNHKNLVQIANRDEIGANVNSRREWFRSFTHALRSLHNESDNMEDCDRSLIKDLYLNVDMIDKLGEIFSQIHESNRSSLKDTWEYLNRTYSHEGIETELFDAHFFGNVPFSLGKVDLGDGHKVQLLRMPSITKDLTRSVLSTTTDVKIIEQFDLFLKALKIETKKPFKGHFYVNVMSRKFGNEVIRSRKIEELDADSAKPITVVTLDKNSIFYKQEREFSVDKMQKEAFTAEFLNQMTQQDGHFYFPKILKKSHLETILKEVSDLDIFKDSRELTLDLRGLFIENVYVRIIETTAKLSKASSMNISCLNCIDRGASQIFTLLKHLEKKNGTNSLTDKQMKTLLFTPALMVAHRPIFELYFKRVCGFVGEPI